MQKRLSLWAALVAASFAGLAPAAAETPDQFPTKPITLIVPFQAGVTADLLFSGVCRERVQASRPAGDHRQQAGRQRHAGAGRRWPPAPSRTATRSGRSRSPYSASPTCRRRRSIRSRTSPTSSCSAATAWAPSVKADGPFKTVEGRHRVRQGQSRQVHLRDDRPGDHQCHRHGADGAPVGRAVHAYPDQGRRRVDRAVLGGHIMAMMESRPGRRWWPSGEFRLLMMLSGERSKKWPDTPILKELGYTYEFDSPVRPGRPQGHGPGHRQEAARRLQEGL